jgi:hypothetical protein
MSMAGLPNRDPAGMAGMLRHRRAPVRIFGDTLIAARPRDGAPVVMESTAALIWHELDGWTTVEEIDLRLAEAFPQVPNAERVAARIQIVTMLRDDDLIERA